MWNHFKTLPRDFRKFNTLSVHITLLTMLLDKGNTDCIPVNTGSMKADIHDKNAIIICTEIEIVRGVTQCVVSSLIKRVIDKKFRIEISYTHLDS